MTPAIIPFAQDVVLIGGGHTHALLLRAWGMKPVAGARLTLINPAPSAPYTGMLPGHIAGHYDRDALEIDLVKLARHAGARLIFGMVEAIDRADRKVIVEGRPPISYDIASLDIGITSSMPDLPGFAEHDVAAKPLGPFAERWRQFLEEDAGRPVVVIGGGVAGVELAFAMRHRMLEAGSRGALTVIDSDIALSGLGVRTRSHLLAGLAAQNIALVENAIITDVFENGVSLGDGRQIDAALVVGAAGARPFSWLSATGLHLTDGYVTVDETLRSVTDPAIYAAGDCAHLLHAPRPKAGVFAVRAAPILTRNIRADLTGTAHKRFRPQAHYLKLISLGRKAALAEKWGHSVGGDWAWTWKDRIDRRFMERLSALAPMAAPPAPPLIAQGAREALGAKPLCGGCGAKVGSDTLGNMLSGLPATARDDIETGAGDDAAVLTIGGARQVITTDHLRAVWDDPYMMARIALCHALGDVWAMGAEPQAILSQITLPRMSENMQADWLGEITAAAQEIAVGEGAALVGGHTSLGAEMTIGFTVTGLLSGAAITQSGAVEGDALILTRPIGAGTILAGEMALAAHGRDVRIAIDTMAKPQGAASRILKGAARAMTDVTGFGLAGHVARMADAAGLTADLRLDAIPVYAGAETLAGQGVRSTIYPANRAAVTAEVPDTPRGVLLFDPQTSGGLLAAVPEQTADGLLRELRDAGHDAHQIGQMQVRDGVSVRAR